MAHGAVQDQGQAAGQCALTLGRSKRGAGAGQGCWQCRIDPAYIDGRNIFPQYSFQRCLAFHKHKHEPEAMYAP